MSNQVDHEFRFETPPATAGRKTGEVIENLKLAAERPGEWARIGTYPSAESAYSVASALRRGKRSKRRPPGRWEFKGGRDPDSDGGAVWALFLGTDEEGEP